MSGLRSHRWLYALAVLILGGLFFLGNQAQTVSSATPSASSSNGSSSAAAAPQAQAGDSAAIYRGVAPVVKFDVSPPLSSMSAPEPPPGLPREMRETENPGAGKAGPQQDKDALVQSIIGPLAIPTPIISFDSNPNLCACSPPDPTGEVGPNHYVSMSNLHTQIFNRSGVSLLGPVPNNTFWAGFGGACQTENAGDPIVLYDQLADRWLLSQFTSAGPTYYNCVALSTTPDPTGTYYRWAFSTGSNFPDYPKYGVWPNAYFISTREFAGASFAGVGAYAGNRAQMIAGNPNPTLISFLVPPGGQPYRVGDGLLPSDLDGSTLPPANSPNYFVGSQDNGGPYGAPSDALNLWKFIADFGNPPNSSFTLANTIPIQAFDTMPAFCSGRNCVPQPSTTNRLDHLGYRQRPTMRLAYRNFGTHESLVTNQSIEATTTMSGIRWWEIRSPNNNPVIYQEGTYAPGTTDGIHRWMGSIAMDRMGNMGLGYSASSATLFPSIRYTGRLATDPLGEMPQGEASIHEGTGSQTSSQRWGDYTHMAIDPVDDCTFWYINEYVPVTSGNGWRQRVGAFKHANCVQGTPTPTVTGTPPTATRTSTATNTVPVTPSSTRTATVTPDPCAGNYMVTPTTGATIVPGTTDTGNHCDDCVTSVTLPFPFRLYDQTYNSVSVSSNGNAQFVGSLTDYTNTCLPGAGFTYTIFPYWDDLRTDTGANCPTGGCGIFTSVSGTAPNRIFNIEWRAVLFSGGALANFELRLYEATPSRFDVIYGANPGNTSATGGVQRDSTRFTQAFCNGSGQATTAGTMLAYVAPPCPTGTVTTPGTTSTSTATRTGTAQVSPTVCPPGGGAWTAGPNFSATAVVRSVGVYFPANGRFYSMGGRSADAAGNHLLNPHEYNPATNTWTQKSAQHPDADVSNMACGVLTDAGTPYIYCAGGSAGGGTTATPRMFRYNPVTDVITAVNAPWPGNTNNDVVPGGFAVANNKLYIIGGFQINTAMTNQTWEFTPGTNAWVQKANLPVARGYVPATTIGNMIYTAGGSDYTGGALVDMAESYRFDPVANTWTPIPNTPRATAETRAVTLNGEMWVLGGGRTAPNPSSMVEIYNPASNTWRQGPAFTTARRNFAADSNGTDRIWIVGGYAPTAPTNTMEIFAGTGGVCPTPSVGTPGTSTATRTVTQVATTAVATTAVPSSTATRTSTAGVTMTGTAMPTGTMMPSMTATMMATGTMMPTRTAVPCNGRITVCHRTGNGNSHSISISCSALNAHLNHGDTVGPCPAATRTPRANPFRDISTGDYFYEHTLDLRYAEAIGGYNDGTFRPYNQATRAQLVKIVVLAFDIPLYNGSEQSFSDVPRDHPFYQYIMTAKRDNIITGYNDGTFRPYANVTRGQIAKIAVESARMADLSSDGPSFRDVPTNHTFFRHIETAYANGILSGYADGTFRPDADATRGQITKIVNLATHPGTGPNRAHLDETND